MVMLHDYLSDAICNTGNTAQQIASKAGVDNTTLCNYTSGRRSKRVDPMIIWKIAVALDLNPFEALVVAGSIPANYKDYMGV